MKIIILGNGIAGITCARTIRKNSDHEVVIISSETKHFWSRTALMYIYMGQMRYQDTKPYEDGFWKKNKLELVQDRINSLDISGKTLIGESGEIYHYDKLLLATGSVPNIIPWKGVDLKGVTPMYSYQDLQQIESLSEKTKSAVIVGGGLIGIELAEMLWSRGIKVTMLIREKNYWGNILPKDDAELVQEHTRSHGIELLLETELEEIKGNSEGGVSSVLTKNGREIPCEFVGVTTGVRPNVGFLANSGLDIGRGIMIKRNMQCSVEDVFAAGDCAEFIDPPKGRNPIEQVWYTGRTQGEVAAKNILGENTEYSPGPWFNSAKFFELEYQTYGNVPSVLPAGQRELVVRPAEEELIHFVFEEGSMVLLGVNLFGHRGKHSFWERHLALRSTMETVLENLNDGLFNPEFQASPIKAVRKKFNEEIGSKVYENQ